MLQIRHSLILPQKIRAHAAKLESPTPSPPMLEMHKHLSNIIRPRCLTPNVVVQPPPVSLCHLLFLDFPADEFLYLCSSVFIRG
jgi:hypothetical protein